MSVRKIVLALLLIVSICLCYTTAVNGLNLFGLTVPSYAIVDEQNKELETELSEMTRMTTTDFGEKQNAVAKAIVKYNEVKEQYEALAPTVASMSNDPQVIDIGIKPYDIEYLLVRIGEYATRENVTITFNVIQSTSQVLASVGSEEAEYYRIADINFTVLGEYNNIIEFLYHIEDDDELNFEIKNFKMGPSSSNVQATFDVKNIPINTKNLSTLAPQATDGADIDPNNPLNIDSNAVNKNLISDDVKSSAGVDDDSTDDSTDDGT